MNSHRNNIPRQVSEQPPSSIRRQTRKQTVVETLEAPMLTGVSLRDFIEFKRKRDKYEREISEKNKEEGVEITLASYLTSVDRPVLELMWLRKYIERDSLDEITEDDVKECISHRARRKPGDFEIAAVEKTISNVHIKMSIPGAENRIDTLLLDYKKALDL
eukprot:IDg23513t1